MSNTLKIAYILLAGIGVFFVNNLWVLMGVFAFHFLLYFTVKNPQKSLRFLWKIKWFVLIIFIFHALSGANDIELLRIKKWVLALSFDGCLEGGIAAFKLLSMLMITQVVRFSMSKHNFIKGMNGLGLSQSTAQIIDDIIEIVHADKPKNKGGGNGRGGGNGKGGNGGKEKNSTRSIDVLLKGKVGNLPKKLIERLNFASDKFKHNSNANIASAALAITLIRMVKIAPGLPLAPGHKNVLMIPVFIHGILKTKKPFAGAQIGSISGILHFSMGFGKYGPLGILEFTLLGGVIDLMLRLPFKKNNLFFLMLVGGAGGATRIATELSLAYILGMPREFFLLYLPYIILQIAFGVGFWFPFQSIINNKRK